MLIYAFQLLPMKSIAFLYNKASFWHLFILTRLSTLYITMINWMCLFVEEINCKCGISGRENEYVNCKQQVLFQTLNVITQVCL